LTLLQEEGTPLPDHLARQVQAALEALAYAYGNVDAGARATDLQRALAVIPAVRDRLDRLELLLVDVARFGAGGHAGAPPITYRHWLTWQEVATALGLESRQAAEQRYGRLRDRYRDAAPAPATTTTAAHQEEPRHA